MVCEGTELFKVPEKPQHLSLFSSPSLDPVRVSPPTTNISFTHVEVSFVLKKAEEFQERMFWPPFVRFLDSSFKKTPRYIKNLLSPPPSLSRNSETIAKVNFLDKIYKTLRSKLKIGVAHTTLGSFDFTHFPNLLADLHPELEWKKAIKNDRHRKQRGTVVVSDAGDFPIMSTFFGKNYHFLVSETEVDCAERGWGYEKDSRGGCCCFVRYIYFCLSLKGQKVEVQWNAASRNDYGTWQCCGLPSSKK